MPRGANKGEDAGKAALHGVHGQMMIERPGKRFYTTHAEELFGVAQATPADVASARQKEIEKIA